MFLEHIDLFQFLCPIMGGWSTSPGVPQKGRGLLYCSHLHSHGVPVTLGWPHGIVSFLHSRLQWQQEFRICMYMFVFIYILGPIGWFQKEILKCKHFYFINCLKNSPFIGSLFLILACFVLPEKECLHVINPKVVYVAPEHTDIVKSIICHESRVYSIG